MTELERLTAQLYQAIQRLEDLDLRVKVLELERHCDRERTSEQAERTA